MSDYATVRDHLGRFVGRTIVDVTQHDEEYFRETGRAFVDLMFDSGDVIRFYAPSGLCFAVNPSTDGEEEIFNE